MKITIVSLTTVLAFLFTSITARITVSTLPGVLYIAHNYTLTWNSTTDYTYDIWLVEQHPTDGSERYSILAADLHPASLVSSYTWTVPSNLSTQSDYRFWLSGLFRLTEFNSESESSYTNYFKVAPSASPTSNTSPSATASTVPAGASNTSSNSNSTSSHSTNISGGAIAGIVIGCIAIVALVIGAILFVGWRRKRSSKQQREADTRANRLAPVMQKGSDAFEMHNTPPRANKEFDA